MPTGWFCATSGKTVGSLGYGFGKDRLYEEAMGLGLGQGALDEFARNNGAKDWESLNWNMDVNQDPAMWSSGGWGSGTFIGNTNTRRAIPICGAEATSSGMPMAASLTTGRHVRRFHKDSPDYQEKLKRDAWLARLTTIIAISRP